MASDYEFLKFKPTSFQIDILKSYYTHWEYTGQINLKFRFVKVFGLDLITNKPKWILLQQFVNKRRIPNNLLKISILSLFENNFVPIRIFHSVTEWLNPNEINKPNASMYLINSGLIVLENDDSLDISIKTAKQLISAIKEDSIMVYSGNKSIHTWIKEFRIKDYLQITDDILYHPKRREKYERKLRRKILEYYQNQISYELDRRAAEDSRRVVPIIGTINGFTGRIVTEIDSNKLEILDSNKLVSETQLADWQH